MEIIFCCPRLSIIINFNDETIHRKNPIPLSCLICLLNWFYIHCPTCRTFLLRVDIKHLTLFSFGHLALLSEMGFSLASSNLIDYNFSSKISNRQTAVRLSDGKGREPLHLKISKLRPQSRKIFSCKIAYPDFDERTSPNEVKKEIQQCYEVINRLGRGVVYLGSSRMGPGHPHYNNVFQLGRKVAGLLDCTSWSGAGPGLMDAATKGALQAGKPVGGFKIGKEAGEWTATNFHPYLPPETYLTCRFFSARKHGLVDAAVRASNSDRTAVVALPGGVGTLDEMFEIMALIQLERIGSLLPVPFLLMNYDSFYSKLLEFLDDCEQWGTVSKGEVASLWKVCDSNSEALAYLAEFYSLPIVNSDGKTKLEKNPVGN